MSSPILKLCCQQVYGQLGLGFTSEVVHTTNRTSVEEYTQKVKEVLDREFPGLDVRHDCPQGHHGHVVLRLVSLEEARVLAGILTRTGLAIGTQAEIDAFVEDSQKKN